MQKPDMLENNLRIMEVVEKELNRRKGEATFCFSVFLAATSVWVMLVELWRLLGKPIPLPKMTYGVEIIAILMFILTQTKTKLKLKDLGFGFKNIKTSLIRAGIISAVVAAVMLAAKIFVKPGAPGTPFFDWSRTDPFYPLTSILQEFLARGFLLTCLMSIYDTEKKKHISVILSSLLFTALHLQYGFLFMVGAGILSVILGYVYIKDENIWGVSIIHFVFGTLGSALALAA